MTALEDHIVKYPGVPGETAVATCGMAVDNFTDQDANAVRALLAKHSLAERFHVLHGVQDTDDFYGLVPAGAGTTEDDDILIILNGDDETHGTFPDKTVPGLFIFELCRLLAAVAGRGSTGSTIDYMIEAARKGLAITADTQPTWSDYEWLLKR
jgi:hypothetical protein